MRKTLRILPVLAVAALLAGCEGPCQKIDTINGPTLTSGSADFSVVAGVGTSISAGYQSGGLVSRHQVRAFPALFAAQTGHTVLSAGTGDFTFNAIDNDGLGFNPDNGTPVGLMRILSLSPLIISSTGATVGSATNTAQATDYHALGVPGQLAADFVDSTFYGFGGTSVHPITAYFDLIYRHRGLGVQQLVRRAPTFVTFELGANEVLGAATSGTANIFPVANYVAAVRGALGTIHAALPNTKLAVFNIPGVTSIPYCTTLSPVTVSVTTQTPLALIGPGGTPLSPTALVLLGNHTLDSLAVGTGFPADGYNYINPAVPGNGRPLRNSQVLDDDEQTTINNAIFGMNTAIDSLVANRPWTTKVDLNTLLSNLRANGVTIGSTTYTTDFVTGGLFSLDGVHPNDLAHAIICNTLIDAVNSQWGSTIPRLIVSDYATPTSSRAGPATGERIMPRRVDGLEALRSLFPTAN